MKKPTKAELRLAEIEHDAGLIAQIEALVKQLRRQASCTCVSTNAWYRKRDIAKEMSEKYPVGTWVKFRKYGKVRFGKVTAPPTWKGNLVVGCVDMAMGRGNQFSVGPTQVTGLSSEEEAVGRKLKEA